MSSAAFRLALFGHIGLAQAHHPTWPSNGPSTTASGVARGDGHHGQPCPLCRTPSVLHLQLYTCRTLSVRTPTTAHLPYTVRTPSVHCTPAVHCPVPCRTPAVHCPIPCHTPRRTPAVDHRQTCCTLPYVVVYRVNPYVSGLLRQLRPETLPTANQYRQPERGPTDCTPAVRHGTVGQSVHY